ncbi:MerR family transcriptional regulator [Streptomyces sp. NPDC048442]|uniref:MerR family transcriptional regulator n=1 Tax=Streptomyces sp. NPDC048442 TaxID=3154823 RepID=UPI00342A0480
MGETEAGVGGSAALLSIGAFARRVGLAPSALRFYDDCGVLRPERVDGSTGYRFYAPGQVGRAVLVRRLREAGVPLVDAAVVLDGAPDDAREVLLGHARRTRDVARAAGALIEEILRGLPAVAEASTPVVGGPAGGGVASVRLGGAELASAVRQVVPAVATGTLREEFPVLGCVLVEWDGGGDGEADEVRLVATDRYRLVVRVLRATATGGGPGRVLVGAEELREVGAWALRAAEVEWETGGGGRSARARVAGEAVGASEVGEAGQWREVAPYTGGEFPQYRMVLDGLSDVRHRVIVERAALRGVLAGGGGPVVLTSGAEGELVCEVRGAGRREVLRAVVLRAVVLGAVGAGPGAVRVAFDAEVLLQALDVGVGPDVLLEIASAVEPVVVRSADQGSFTTLVMPVKDEGDQDGDERAGEGCGRGESGSAAVRAGNAGGSGGAGR